MGADEDQILCVEKLTDFLQGVELKEGEVDAQKLCLIRKGRRQPKNLVLRRDMRT